MALHYICIEDLGNFLMCHSRGGGEQQTRTNAPSFMVKKNMPYPFFICE